MSIFMSVFNHILAPNLSVRLLARPIRTPEPMEEDNVKPARQANPGITQRIMGEVPPLMYSLRGNFWDSRNYYESSARLLNPQYTEAEWQQQRAQGQPLTFVIWVKLFITLFPIIAMPLSFGILIGTGVDPLAFSLLSLFLTMALVVYVIVIACIRLHVKKRKTIKLLSTTSPQPSLQRPDWREPLFHSLGMFGIYVIFYGIIWGWAVLGENDTKGPPAVWHIYEVSRDLQAKISASNALSRLGSCLREAIPGRNATIEDVEVCLRAMGMNESYVG